MDNVLNLRSISVEKLRFVGSQLNRSRIIWFLRSNGAFQGNYFRLRVEFRRRNGFRKSLILLIITTTREVCCRYEEWSDVQSPFCVFGEGPEIRITPFKPGTIKKSPNSSTRFFILFLCEIIREKGSSIWLKYLLYDKSLPGHLNEAMIYKTYNIV